MRKLNSFPYNSIIICILFCLSLSSLITIDYLENSGNENSIILESNSSLFDQKRDYIINAPVLSISRIFEINDDYLGNSIGDGDNLVDAGEKIELRLEIENQGDQIATNVYGNLTCSNPLVTLTSTNQSFLQIDAGSTGVSESYYILEFDSKFNISDEIIFSVLISASEGSWSDTFTLTIQGIPDPEFYGHIVTNELSGGLNADDDEIIDPGEQVYFAIYIENKGESNFYNVDGYISTTDVFTTILDNMGSFGTIDNGTIDYGYYAIDVSGACPIGHIISFNLSLEDKFSNLWNSTFELVVSGTPRFQLADITFYEYTGDGDEFMDAGEAWYPQITIKNNGTALGSNVYVSIDSEGSNLDFYYEFESRDYAYNDIFTGFEKSKVTSYNWRFTISEAVDVEQIIELEIIIEADNVPTKSISSDFEIAGIADYNVTAFTLYEYCYYDDDCDEIVSSGDTFIANISIMNIGKAIGKDVEIFLYSADELIEFYYGNGTSTDYSTVLENETIAIDGYYYWEFTISERAKVGHEIEFTIVITDASLREWTFTTSIVVESGPGFFNTLAFDVIIIAGIPLITIIAIVYNVRKKKKQKKEDESEESKSEDSESTSWFEVKKEEFRKRKEDRKKERKLKKEEKEAIRQQKERERIARINENEKRLLEKFENILEMSDRVALAKVSKSLGLSESQLFEKLIQWQDNLPFQIDGEYLEVEDTDNFSQSIREKIAETIKYYSCAVCGFPIERTSEICPDCKTPVEKCAVCKLPISFGDNIGKCSLCENKGHLSHMQEWIKTQGKCPVCLQNLTIDKLISEGLETKKK